MLLLRKFHIALICLDLVLFSLVVDLHLLVDLRDQVLLAGSIKLLLASFLLLYLLLATLLVKLNFRLILSLDVLELSTRAIVDDAPLLSDVVEFAFFEANFLQLLLVNWRVIDGIGPHNELARGLLVQD